MLRQGKDILVDLDAEGRLVFVVKGLKVVSGQAVDDDKERIVSLCREKNGMLKIYLNGELEQSVYDVAIVNPNIKEVVTVSNRGQHDRINDDNILFAGDIDAVCWIYRSNTQVIYAVHIGSICPIRTVYIACK